jgi:hypothetical protein
MPRAHLPAMSAALELDEFGSAPVCPGSAQRGLSDKEENGTANHAEHAKGSGALQGQDYALELKPRLAEVEQQAEMQVRGFQIVEALRAMDFVDRLQYLQFDEDDVFDKQVNSIFPDHYPIVSNDHGMLLRDGESRLAKLVDRCVFLDFLKESRSQRLEHRQGAADDSFEQEVNPTLTGIHLRVLRDLRFHFPCLLPAQPFQFVDASYLPTACKPPA